MLILILGIVVISGCSSTNSESSTNYDQSKDGEDLKIDIPDSPPEFNLPTEFSDLEVSDYTKSLNEVLPNEKIIYSAIWTFDKEYTLKWEEMSQDQKNNFDSLKETVIKSLNQGVENLGGEFIITKSTSYDIDGATQGRWDLKHESNSRVKIWRVDFNAGYIDAYGKPFMNIYIANTKLE